MGWDANTGTTAVILPAMVKARQCVLAHETIGQARPAVGTTVLPGMDFAVPSAPNRQIEASTIRPLGRLRF